METSRYSKRNILFLLSAMMSLAACHSGGKTTPNNARDTAQPASGKPPVPHMWVSDSASRVEETNFLHFDTLLGQQYGPPETDSIFYPVQEFRALIDTCATLPGITYLDIYPVVPGSGKLSLLFVPKDAQYNILANFQLQENVTTFDRHGDSVSPVNAAAWELTYKNTVNKSLKKYLDTTDAYNYTDCDSGKMSKFSNTLHLLHKFSDFVEWCSEVDYQKASTGNTISGFKAFFSSYSVKPKGTQKGFSNRLFILLEFTVDDAANNHRVYAIDTSQRHYQGPDYPIVNTPCKVPYIRSGDNGQMCPPTCTP